MSRTDDVLRFSLENVSGSVQGYLSTWAIVISVDFEQTTWDLIFFAGQLARRIFGGYICNICMPQFQQGYPNLKTLWTEHLFEPLLARVNEELATANWLVLEGKPGRYTTARLASERAARLRDRVTDLVRITIPLRSRRASDTDLAGGRAA